jgi:phage tail-like protein
VALPKQKLKKKYPIPVYNFRVTVGGTAMSFSEVSGVVIEYESVTYRHGFSFWEGDVVKNFQTRDKYVPVTLNRGTVNGDNRLFEWLEAADMRPMDISLCDEKGKPVVSWKIKRAMPVKFSAPTFDASTNDVFIESLEVSAAGITVEHHPTALD